MDKTSFLKRVGQGDNVLLTGPAGTGKSTLLNAFLETAGNDVAVTASTGIAALNVGGSTLHRWSGMMLGPKAGEDPRTHLRELLRDKRQSVRAGLDRVRECRVLIIDEVSMLSGTTLAFFDLLCRTVRRDPSPFGGIQIVATGDALQLPPVRINPAEPYDWFFQTPCWRQAGFAVIHLTRVHRQQDPAFQCALGEFRLGKLSPDSSALLASRVSHFPDSDIPRLFTHNTQVDKWNAYRLSCIEAPESIYQARTAGPDHQVEFLRKNLLTPERLVLKPGAKVMFTVNKPDAGFVNGQTGTVVVCGKEQVLVESEGLPLVVTPFEWRFDPRDKHSATFTQLPLRLAWSMTIHKCVAVSSRVPTRRGIVPAGEVDVGDLVHTGTNGYARCLAVARSSGRELIKVHTAYGHSITCTPEHPVLAVRAGASEPEFIDAGSLKGGDCLCLSTDQLQLNSAEVPVDLSFSTREKPIRVTSLDESLAHLLGLLVANGSYRMGDTIYLSNPSNEALTLALQTLDSMGIRVGVRTKNPNPHCEHVYFASAPFLRVLEVVGMGRVNASDKRVPEAIWRSPDRVRAAFLRGLFDGDGCASGSVRLVSTSRVLLDEVQTLLLGFGVVGYLRGELYKEEFHHSPSWVLHISGAFLKAFEKSIGFTVAHKRKKLARLVSRHKGKTSIDFIPHGPHIRREVLAAFGSVRSKGIQGRGIKANRQTRLVSILRSYKNLTRHHLGVLAEALRAQNIPLPQSLDQELQRPVFYAPVRWIEPHPVGETVDFEIEGAHRFNADGFVCHNCQGLTLDSAYIDVRAAREPGQAYVAVSRVRTLAGLNLKAWFNGVFVSRAALEFYEALPAPSAA